MSAAPADKAAKDHTYTSANISHVGESDMILAKGPGNTDPSTIAAVVPSHCIGMSL